MYMDNTNSSGLNIKTYSAGELILESGDISKYIFYILSGSVCVNIGDEQQTYNPGKFFGAGGLFFNFASTKKYSAYEDAVISLIDNTNMYTFFKECPAETASIIKSLSFQSEFLSMITVDTSVSDTGTPVTSAVKPPVPAQPSPSSAVSVDAKAVNTTVGTGSISTKITPPAVPQHVTAAATPIPEDAALLFPAGHRHDYVLKIFPEPEKVNEYIYEKKYQCPICKSGFSALTVKQSKLFTENVEADLRVRYKDIEPLYFETVSCPSCFYSAGVDSFSAASANRNTFKQNMDKYYGTFTVTNGFDMNTFSIFTGYYLAIACAPFVASPTSTFSTLGKLWLKLSRLYDDCQDDEMSFYAREQSLTNYMDFYYKTPVTQAQSIQICVLMGELYLRKNDYRNAKKYFFEAKVNKEGSLAYRKHAEDRLDDIRDMEQ